MFSLSYAASGSSINFQKVSYPYASDNTRVYLQKTSALVPVSDGYMRVVYDYANKEYDIVVEYYDSNFKFQKRGYIKKELPVWGGFYKGKDAYYLVEGKSNKDCVDNTEVVRIIKYDTSWNRIGAGSVYAQEGWDYEIRFPFDNSCVSMTEAGGKLYVATGREGYVDKSVGQGHQGMMLIRMDESTFRTDIVKGDFWHSFAQYIAEDRGKLYLFENSEGSRSSTLKKFDSDASCESSIHVLDYGGERTSVWAIECYASADGIATSENNILCIGTSIDQSKYDSVTSDTPHNVYLSVTPVSSFSQESTSIKWLTKYSGKGKCFLGLNLTKINNNRFMVSWEEFAQDEEYPLAENTDTLSGGTIHYLFVDGSGNVLSKEYTAAATLSDCAPVLNGDSIVYCASNSNMVDFYRINATTGAFSKTVYRVAGDDIKWDLKGSVLTFTGEGRIRVSSELVHRSPLSSTQGGYSYSALDGVWKYLRPVVKTIKIGEGIESIPKDGFAFFESLTSVELPDSLKEIGDEAFYSCDALGELYIPSSVNKIGEDILWTGSYWVSDKSKVVHAVIKGECTAYCIKYAEKNDIRYEATHAKLMHKFRKTSSGYSDYWKCSECGRCYIYKDTDPDYEIKVKGKNSDIRNVHKVRKQYYKVLSSKNRTVAFLQSKNSKSVSVPAAVRIGGKTYKVTQINANAFKGSSIRTVTIGKNVKVIKKNAFKGSKAGKIILKTKLLKKAKVKGCLKGSKVKTVQVKVGKMNKKYVKTYKKYFTKTNAGKKVTIN
ncbi:MAG: leucine-rich repeat protein [Oscillospiraceae bacterium]|nr:leucine-rich repeat protein [Oscillospiraceae bacterium]